MNVSEDRLREDILANAEFGAVEAASGHGRTALTGSEANRRARERLVDQMEACGLSVRVDAVGNVAGRWTPDSADPDASPVAAGSHLDSVPRGGVFDGPLGVYAALEAVRAMQDAGARPERPVEVVCFTEEEGQRFGDGLLGSSVAAGALSVDDALALEADDGTTLEAALSEMGFRGEGRIDASEWDAWFELHIEQSTTLESADVPVGIVSAITGITHGSVGIEGESNHAGGTPMGERSDALVAAADFVQSVERAGREVAGTESPFAVATVGELDVAPGASNVIPGQVELSLDIRDTDEAVMGSLVERCEASLARIAHEHEVETAIDTHLAAAPAHMSDRCTDALAASSDRAGIETLRLPSGGGHDTMEVARVTDAGMLFAPSRDGISHSPEEWTDWADCARATQVLAGAMADVAGVDC